MWLSLGSSYVDEFEKWLRAILDDASSRQKWQSFFRNVYWKAATVATELSVFRSPGMWPVNRNEFQDNYLFPCVMNTPWAEFVQPIQAELQDKTELS